MAGVAGGEEGGGGVEAKDLRYGSLVGIECAWGAVVDEKHAECLGPRLQTQTQKGTGAAGLHVCGCA